MGKLLRPVQQVLQRSDIMARVSASY